MLTVYTAERNMLKPVEVTESDLPAAPLWIDLLRPTPVEVTRVEAAGIEAAWISPVRKDFNDDLKAEVVDAH